jgi:uncharacterized protein YabN with tetrapyrrole methylase and pyrophosphatase domain
MTGQNHDPGAALNEFVAIVRRLRGPEGCPWDAQQTPETLKTYVLEEAYELIEALDSGDPGKIKEELGDLLLHLVFLSDLYQDQGAFSLTEVTTGIAVKMINRHPHVFGEAKAETQEDLRRIWHEAKVREGKDPAPPTLGKVSPALPALLQAQRLGEAAARMGFDWPDIQGALAKVEEELGDLLFSLVNVARFLKVDSEGALRGTIYKFIKRFNVVERTLAKAGKTPETATLEEMDAIWEACKKEKARST